MDLLLLILRLLLATALYLFLGTLLLFLWRDLRRPGRIGVVKPRQYGRLIVVDVNAQAEDAVEAPQIGATFPLQLVTSLGRSAINTVTIPDVYASAEHALLAYRGGQWWLEDRGSRNGTTINNVVVGSPTVVSTGDIIGIGQVQLKLELLDS
jgi:hypothetical protein